MHIFIEKNNNKKQKKKKKTRICRRSGFGGKIEITLKEIRFKESMLITRVFKEKYSQYGDSNVKVKTKDDLSDRRTTHQVKYSDTPQASFHKDYTIGTRGTILHGVYSVVRK